MRTAIIYTRVSTDEQGNGYSLSYQKESLERYCLINNIKIIAHFEERHSGKDFERPEFKNLLAFIKENKGKVTDLLFARWDRFARSSRHGLNMIDHLSKFNVTPNACEQPIDFNVPNQILMLVMYLGAGEAENLTRGQNIRNGQRKAISEGRWVSKAPIGYDNSIDPATRKKLLVPNKFAGLVVDAFEMMATGAYSQIEILERINNTGGVRWTKSHISRLFKHTIYCGYLILPASSITENPTLVKGIHEPLITTDLFSKVQQVLSGRTIEKTRPKKNIGNPAYHLKGILTCGNCGSKVRAYFTKRKKYGYYECKVCEKPERMPLEIANQFIIDFLASMSMSRDASRLYIKVIEEILKNSDNDNRVKIGLLERKLTALNINLLNTDEDYSKRVIAPEDYNRIVTRIKNEIRNIEQEKKELEQSISSIRKYWKFGMRLISDIERYYSMADVATKQRILSSILKENLVLENKKVRTPVLKEAVTLILNGSKPFREIKTGQIPNKKILSRQVEQVGFEPVVNL